MLAGGICERKGRVTINSAFHIGYRDEPGRQTRDNREEKYLFARQLGEERRQQRPYRGLPQAHIIADAVHSWD